MDPTDRRPHDFLSARDGIAAVEFALLSPIIFLTLVLMVDFAYAYYVKIRIISATSAAAQYIFQNGGAISSSGFTTFVSNVQSVVQTTAGLGAAPTVSVLYNNALNASNIGQFYCVNGYAPVTWTSTGTSSASCGSLVQSGKFITLIVNAQASTLFQPDPILGKIINLTETVIVRIE